MTANPTEPETTAFVAAEVAEALRKISEMVKETEKLIKRIGKDRVLAHARGGKNTLSEVDETCGGGIPLAGSDPSGVDHTCGIDVKPPGTEVTAAHICRVLEKIRRWLRYVEDVICQEKGRPGFPLEKS